MRRHRCAVSALACDVAGTAENLPLFLEHWLRHQWWDAYWKHGSVCEEYSAIQCPVCAVGGWTDGYTNAIPRLLTHLTVLRKGSHRIWYRLPRRVGVLLQATGLLLEWDDDCLNRWALSESGRVWFSLLAKV